MSHFRGLFAGLTTVDIQYFVDNYPPANKKRKTKTPDIFIGGPATNAAVAFSYLNRSAFLVSATGDNSFSNLIKSDFQSTGIKHFNLSKNQKKGAVIASVVTSLNNGDRNIFTHHPDKIIPTITPESIFKKTNPEILLLDGFYPEFSIDCAKLAKEKRIPVVLDGGSWKPQYLSLLPFADVVICSSDFHPPQVVDRESLFHFFSNHGVKYAAISRGSKSILFSDRGNMGEVPVKSTKVVDTLGAGDFLHGAFCFHFLSTKFSFREALIKASELATFTCKFYGTREWFYFA